MIFIHIPSSNLRWPAYLYRQLGAVKFVVTFGIKNISGIQILVPKHCKNLTLCVLGVFLSISWFEVLHWSKFVNSSHDVIFTSARTSYRAFYSRSAPSRPSVRSNFPSPPSPKKIFSHLLPPPPGLLGKSRHLSIVACQILTNISEFLTKGRGKKKSTFFRKKS